METRSKKIVRNLIMIILIAIIAVCGTLSVGMLKGWFGGEPSQLVSSQTSEETEEPSTEYISTDDAKAVSGTKESESVSDEKKSKPAASAKAFTCTISIDCKSILKNKENLAKGKGKYVPANGVILTQSSVQFKEGDSVFDVLKRTCSAAGIQMEYSYSGTYGTNYIEGINHLYEFDCGQRSGWIYKVNGKMPNYGASGYKLKNGDRILWSYTCSEE